MRLLATRPRCGALVLLLMTLSIRAKGASKAECLQAHEKGQEMREKGRLREAREAFVVCAQASCPAVVVGECVPWLRDLDATLPSVVIAARKHDGADVFEARLLIDGALVAERLDGSPLTLDPGVHQVRVELPTGSVEQSVVVRHAEKNRLLTLTLPPPAAAASSSAPLAPSAVAPSSGPPLGAWIAAGAGVLSLGAFAYFGLGARSDLDHLKQTCSPRCADSEVDPARTRALVADISLGASVVAFGLATYLWLSHRPAPAPSATRVAPLLGPSVGGAALRFSFLSRSPRAAFMPRRSLLSCSKAAFALASLSAACSLTLDFDGVQGGGSAGQSGAAGSPQAGASGSAAAISGASGQAGAGAGGSAAGSGGQGGAPGGAAGQAGSGAAGQAGGGAGGAAGAAGGAGGAGGSAGGAGAGAGGSAGSGGGCASDLQTDPQNCGSCGRVCSGTNALCASGSCVSTLVGTDKGYGPRRLSLQTGLNPPVLYFTSPAKSDGTEGTLIRTLLSGQSPFPFGIPNVWHGLAVENQLFVLAQLGADRTIGRVIDAKLECLAKGDDATGRLVTGPDGVFFWTKSGVFSLANGASGSDCSAAVTPHVTGNGYFVDLAISSKAILWMGDSYFINKLFQRGIYVVPASSGAPQPLPVAPKFSELHYKPTSVLAAEGSFYWSTSRTVANDNKETDTILSGDYQSKIYRMVDSPTGEPKVLAEVNVQVQRMLVFKGHLYVSAISQPSGLGVVMWGALPAEGSDEKINFTGMLAGRQRPFALETDGQRVYWTERGPENGYPSGGVYVLDP